VGASRRDELLERRDVVRPAFQRDRFAGQQLQVRLELAAVRHAMAWRGVGSDMAFILLITHLTQAFE